MSKDNYEKEGEIMFGAIKVAEQPALKKFPQKAASAVPILEEELGTLAGASYKIIAYVGTQPVKGTNHIFLLEQLMSTAKAERHIVEVSVNEFQGKFSFNRQSFRQIY